MCKSVCEAVLAVIAIVIGIIPMQAIVYKWVLVIIGIILLVHSFTCKSCFNGPMKSIKTPRRR